jgi:hypothetical protein
VNDPSRRPQIAHRLDATAATHDVAVLFACESGSRAWGFSSADSDYDVRFVYAHPRDWYLSIDLERRDDTIDPPVDDDIDLHGWDLRKALQLFRDANPTLLEWLRSPIVYRENEAVTRRWREYIPDYYTPRAVGPAYRGMARSIAAQNLEAPPIPHKAYLYVLRALFAVRWIEADRGHVPVDFTRLLEAASPSRALRDAIDALLTQKQTGTEQAAGPRLPTIHTFIEEELARQDALSFPGPVTPLPADPLHTFFRAVLDHIASSSEGPSLVG